MIKYLVPLLLVVSSATSLRRVTGAKQSAASESQIKFAIENKYDDTGPGAKKPEYAYSTYKTLEDALIAYLDDPDTKLPEHERAKAINKLTQSPYFRPPPLSNKFHQSGEYQLLDKLQFRPLNQEIVYNFPASKIFFPEDTKLGKIGVRELEANDIVNHYGPEQKLEPFKFHKIQSVRGSPLSLAHYTRDPDVKQAFEQFDPHPKYSFSYGVHDKTTGDSKSAHESRDGGTVHGFYSFMDADGKTRTVHYTADDQQGFRATVNKGN
ncbi:uncharacterized protein LOC113496796 isoform X2 [Trichoplusia ni]|uniref:Uncharacterized protein LOC113496796 isoform X2 n=1 Tax=Trichoplusia ni TaxID=7111 RepID=A0A7E5VU95_TRINI|nr:uncharacterized protein LOC113496796 isoform X2 [Trichoplusia ni]